MEEKNWWITFEKTGNIVDYLKYKEAHDISEYVEVGEKAFESNGYCDRNGTVSGADR